MNLDTHSTQSSVVWYRKPAKAIYLFSNLTWTNMYNFICYPLQFFFKGQFLEWQLSNIRLAVTSAFFIFLLETQARKISDFLAVDENHLL